jgi:hypothetical protein
MRHVNQWRVWMGDHTVDYSKRRHELYLVGVTPGSASALEMSSLDTVDGFRLI